MIYRQFEPTVRWTTDKVSYSETSLNTNTGCPGEHCWYLCTGYFNPPIRLELLLVNSNNLYTVTRQAPKFTRQPMYNE